MPTLKMECDTEAGGECAVLVSTTIIRLQEVQTSILGTGFKSRFLPSSQISCNSSEHLWTANMLKFPKWLSALTRLSRYGESVLKHQQSDI